MGHLCFSTKSALWLFCYYSWWHKVLYYSRTAKRNNNNVEVQTFDAIDRFQPKNGTSHFLGFPAHTTQHNCMKYLLKYPSPVKARNPDEQKFVQPSSSKKMWSAYVVLHNVFELHLKIHCTVEFQAPFSLAKCDFRDKIVKTLRFFWTSAIT